ncbi:hypothetical protein FNV43_RR22190 [Rhamnella rubrinervis]|uniref:Uncharacterized protein n=1 Tax=Rhamnella rubrinervis TaxID=2594499 RepID=A0A8K0GSA2_9ROSA|nr:hypothetical protein FNV43_RR22190 [Rhamnella rubrinervis]
MSSEESVGTTRSKPPLPLTTRPSCCSSSSSSTEIGIQNPNSFDEEDEMVANLRSPQVFDVEEALISLRKITRTNENARTHLCTQRLLSTLKTLIVLRYVRWCLGELARSFSQYASGALFSLALDDDKREFKKGSL